MKRRLLVWAVCAGGIQTVGLYEPVLPAGGLGDGPWCRIHSGDTAGKFQSLFLSFPTACLSKGSRAASQSCFFTNGLLALGSNNRL